MSNDAPKIERAFSVRPGDRIIVECPRETTAEQLAECRRQAEEAMPDATVVWLAGMHVVAVERETNLADTVEELCRLLERWYVGTGMDGLFTEETRSAVARARALAGAVREVTDPEQQTYYERQRALGYTDEQIRQQAGRTAP